MIVGLLGGMLLILGTFLILALAFAGVGLIFRRAFGLRELNIDDCFLAFWTGFGVIILILILWNFFLPVGLSALLLVLSLGVVGIVWNRRALIGIFDDRSWRPTQLQLLLLTLGVVWVANQSMAGFRSYDGALYHLQNVKWAKAYAVVPGIANLHGPLAFNNSSFLYDAMLDSGWWEGGAFHVANGLLVIVIVLQAIASGSRFADGGRRAKSSQLFRFLLVAPALYLVPLNGGVTSYSTDLPLTLLLLAATAQMYDLFDVSATQSATTADAYGVFSLSILMATAVCIKSAAAVFAAVAMPVATLLWWKRGPRQETGSARALVWMSLGIIGFAAAWMTRGVVMSGYPLFPLSVGGFPVDWRALAEHADAEFAYIAYTERGFTWRIIGRNWLHLMFARLPYAALIPACLAVSASVGLYWFRKSNSELRETSRNTWWLLLPILVAIGAWFVSAPSHRYSTALFWALAALCLCEFQRVVWPRLTGPGRRWAIIGLVLLGVSPLVVEPARGAIKRGDSAVVAILQHNLITPSPDRWFHPISTQAEVTTFTTRSGLILNIPKRVRGPAVQPNSCWDAPIPCTPNPAPNLQLRQAGILDKGFRVEGGWQMQNWPYYWHAYFLPEWRDKKSGAAPPR